MTGALLHTLPPFALSTPLLRIAPDVAFVVALLACCVVCAALAVAVAHVVEVRVSRMAKRGLPRKRGLPGWAVGLGGLVLAGFAWGMMSFVPGGFVQSGASGWGVVAAAGLFGIAAIARAVLRGPQRGLTRPQGVRPESNLATPLSERHAA
jgi:hypothetical protein